MPHVFISYLRRDRARAASLVRNLQLAGVSVFQDVLSIGPGAKWQEEIKAKLGQSKVVLFLASSASIASPTVNQELGMAIAAAKPIIPVLLDVAPGELPPFIAAHQAVVLHGRNPAQRQQSVIELMRAIAEDQRKSEREQGIAALLCAGLLFWLASQGR